MGYSGRNGWLQLLLGEERDFNQVDGFLRDGTPMSCGRVPQFGMESFRKGFNNECRHGE